jgi:protein-tyrosine kinase
MSRNFELLQQAARERDASLGEQLPPSADEVGAHGSAAGPGPVLESRGSSTLEMDDLSREEITKLVQRLFLLSSAARTMVFAGVDARSGCSWMTSRTADVLAAQVTGSVCIVDANFRSPSLHTVFAVDNHYGLTDALSQPGPIRQFTRSLGGNLWLLSCGSKVSNGQTLLNSELLRTRLAELRNEFDYVLIDTPPLNVCADPIAVGQLADGVALVLEANVTHRETARKVAQDLMSANVRLLGVVLNKRTFPIPESLYKKL